MLIPSSHPWMEDEALGTYLKKRGVSRRDFVEFCSKTAAVLGLTSLAIPKVAHALETQKRPSVIWIQLQECTGCVESVLRASDPSIGDLVLDVVSLDASEALMAGAGSAYESALQKAMKDNFGKYLLVVTGSVPLEHDGIYLTIAGRTAKSILEEAAKGAAAIIALGACAHWGSVQAAKPNPTGAVGVSDVI